MIRLSFRQSLLLGFLVMVALLAWSALESWLVLEQLTVRLQRTNARALELREAVQSLAERTVDLERGARQYLILSDPAVLDHFERNASAALASLGRVENIPGGGFRELTDSWRQELTRLSSSVREGKGSDDLAASLSRLAQINASLARDSRHWIDTQHTVWSDALEERRRDLTRLLVAVVIAVCLVAVALGWWLARPIATIERAIADLGQSRFERKIAVSGPADLRRVGRRLDWLRNRLRELEAERERTLRHVSHELKTPLTALREGVALLHDEVTGPLSVDQSEVVGILQHNVLTLQRQIEGLLRLNASAIEARRLVDRPAARASARRDARHPHSMGKSAKDRAPRRPDSLVASADRGRAGSAEGRAAGGGAQAALPPGYPLAQRLAPQCRPADPVAEADAPHPSR